MKGSYSTGAGAFNIYPREIEDVLYEQSKVLEVDAAGIPVKDKGERVKVYVVLKEGETATDEEIIAFCRENLAPTKCPSSSNSAPTCPRPSSARSCDGCWSKKRRTA